MILYFSATGNTEFVAKEVAKRLDDECINILNRVRENDYTPVYSEKPYIICAPVYVCEMPMFMASYLKKLKLNGSRDVYFIFTSGGYCGISGLLAKWMFMKKWKRFKGYTEVVLPRNYVANDAYPMLTIEEIENRIINTYNRLDEIVDTIRTGGNLQAIRKVQLWEILVTVPFTPVWYKMKLKADDFYAKDRCIGCDKCARLCPLNNITIKDKKPVWGDNCTHCMACIGNCPVEAIHYGMITQKKRQYNFGKYKYVIDNLKKEEGKE
ncbi:MAG: EFR1 family ferrodoxin [Peptococcaceae bacterium]|nr:EFR1 family ferrodoxin [Peptococcaceae bacterium]